MTTKDRGVTLQRLFDYIQIIATGATKYWKFVKSGSSENLLVQFNASSGDADVSIEGTGSGTSGIRFGTGTDSGALISLQKKINVAINFGVVGANTTADAAVAITSVDNSYTAFITPLMVLPAGITISIYWDTVGLTLKARAMNTTGAGVAVSGNFNVLALKVR